MTGAAKAPSAAQPKRKLAEGVKYAKADIMALKRIFDETDTQGNGRLTSSELRDALTAQAAHGSAVHLTHLDIMRVADLNHDNEISFSELLHVLYPYATTKEMGIMMRWAYPPKTEILVDETFHPTEEQLLEIKRLFILYDTDKDAAISFQELQHMAETCGYDPKEVEGLFLAADVDQDLVICFDEFVQMMKISYC